MRRGFKLIIAGTAILVVGIVLVGTTFVILKQQSLSINSSFETISPGKSILKAWDVKAGKKMAIVVNYQPSDVPLNIQVIQRPHLSKILDLNFSHSLFTNFVSNKNSLDNIMITNLGTREVNTNTIYGSVEFFDTGGQPKTAFSVIAIAGPLISLIGIIVLIVGAILLIKGRTRKDGR
jgi:hypothetical protein